MRRGLFVLAAFVLLAMSGRDAHAAKFGTSASFQYLQDLTARGPKGEALALGYVSTTHYFFLAYRLTGDYVLVSKGTGKDLSGRPLDVYDTLTADKIAQMQNAGKLPNPLPPYRIRFVDYLMGYVLWWSFPLVFVFIALFSKLGIGRRTRDETRPA